ncbi:MAG: hypothetical protein QXS85_00225 [Acidilobaceae archaeon]
MPERARRASSTKAESSEVSGAPGSAQPRRGQVFEKRASEKRVSARRAGRALEVSAEALDKVAEEAAIELWEALGLAGVCEKQVLAEVARRVAEEATQGGREPDKELIVKTLLRVRDKLYRYVAVKLLERGVESLSDSQLEFLIVNAPEIAGSMAPQLYRALAERKLGHLVDMLRDLWQSYGKPLPVKCPYCGFQAVAPDYSCIVCGRNVSEDEVKKALGFEDLLVAAAQNLPLRLAEEIMLAGYAVYDGEIKPPSMRSQAEPIAYTITLSKRERSLLAEIILRRRLESKP